MNTDRLQARIAELKAKEELTNDEKTELKQRKQELAALESEPNEREDEDTSVTITARIPASLYDEIGQRAKSESVSRNALVVRGARMAVDAGRNPNFPEPGSQEALKSDLRDLCEAQKHVDKAAQPELNESMNERITALAEKLFGKDNARSLHPASTPKEKSITPEQSWKWFQDGIKAVNAKRGLFSSLDEPSRSDGLFSGSAEPSSRFKSKYTSLEQWKVASRDERIAEIERLEEVAQKRNVKLPSFSTKEAA